MEILKNKNPRHVLQSLNNVATFSFNERLVLGLNQEHTVQMKIKMPPHH